MPRVKCPHCGAGNQDATEQDTCWQCSNVLGAPVTRAEAARPAQSVIPSEPTQQLNIEMLKKIPLPPQQAAKNASPSPLVLVLVALLVMAVIVILALTLRH